MTPEVYPWGVAGKGRTPEGWRGERSTQRPNVWGVAGDERQGGAYEQGGKSAPWERPARVIPRRAARRSFPGPFLITPGTAA
jgi:hypothetical protein